MTDLDPKGLAAGGSRVDHAFAALLHQQLLSVQNLDQQMLPRLLMDGMKDFEEDAKRQFDSPSTECHIDLRSRNITDKVAGIEAGTLTLQGYVEVVSLRTNLIVLSVSRGVIELCFAPSISKIVKTLQRQVAAIPRIEVSS